MEARINYHIRGVFMLDEKPIPPSLNKHLTNKIFNKPNKDAMEQVIHYLLQVINKKCLKSLPWPLTTPKEFAEFRNVAISIINGLEGFAYEKCPEKSSNFAKVNCSLLANPGGSMFIFLMYQFCLYVKRYQLYKKGIVLNAPLYVKDEYFYKKIAMFVLLSKSNFNKVNKIISRVDSALCKTSELVVKWKEIIQDCKQQIKYLKSELSSIEYCQITENEISVLKQKYINLYSEFEQNKLMSMKCARLADIILKAPETVDIHTINLIFSINKENFIGCNGKVDLVYLLTLIKNALNNCINWCQNLFSKENVDGKLFEVQQSIIVMTEHIKCYDKTLICQNTMITNLENENQELNKEVFTCENLENIDPRIQSVYKKSTPIIFNTEFNDKPKSITSEYNKKNRKSVSISCSNKPCYNYQTMSYNSIKEVYKATLLQENQIDISDNVKENKEYSFPPHATNQKTWIALSPRNQSLQYNTPTSNNQPVLTDHQEDINKTNDLNISHLTQTQEDEVKSVSISRKSIENIKQKYMKIKTQAQSMSTIPHSPQSPF